MSDKFRLAICKMIGIDPSNVSAIQINIEVNKIPTADVTYLLLKDGHEHYEDDVQTFEIVEMKNKDAD